MVKILTVVRQLACALLLLFLLPSFSQAERDSDYDQIASNTFWQKLYPSGGWSLYCGYKFVIAGKSAGGQTIVIEHIFPTARMAIHKGCQSRMQCRESKNPDFIRMEADLHNMYPAWQTVIMHRTNFRFGLVNGEEWRFDDCDLEWKAGIAEPRQIA
jgi:deoxyribonuclease-1